MPATITVLMPVYNAQKFLREAMDSILQQTYPHFEFLIIDDGSTDDSIAIVEAYDDARIRLVRNEKNMGITATLNKGIDLASGEYIARMDADDISYPQRLQRQFDFIQAHPQYAMVSTWAREISFEDEVLLTERINPDFYYYNLTFECWIYHPTVMYRKSAVHDIGKYMATYSEDYDLWWRLSRKYAIYILPEVLLDYRTSASSLSRVLKKTEYENAHFAQLMRNIHYYTGTDYTLTNSEAEFLRSYMEPVLEEGKTAIVRCFKKLEYITGCIVQKEGAEQKERIQKAAFYKKQRTVNILKDYLSKKDIIQLLIQLGYWQLLILFLKQNINKMLYPIYATLVKRKGKL